MHTCYSLSDALRCCSVYHFPPHHPAATILVERFELGKGLSQCEAQSRRTPGSVWFYIEYCQKGPLAKLWLSQNPIINLAAHPVQEEAPPT